MNLNFRKILILGLVGVFLLAAFFCCCFTNTVQAQEPTPSCHETTHDTESSQNTQECECESLAVIKDATVLKASLEQITTLSLDQQLKGHVYISAKVDAYQAPPIIYDTSPLYIKHSILRI